MRALLLSLLVFAAFAAEPAVAATKPVDTKKEIKDPRMEGLPESADACRKLADDLENESLVCSVKAKSKEGDPAWKLGTPEYKNREVKLDKYIKRINYLRGMALHWDERVSPPAKEPKDK